ncbi:MAG TPA: Re/Si-specific NAD(P)(+) transhydrogenase subunit alpha [Candidatus Limnocylindrales bacterium]|nr:Re/Si-specific NAD(P)(+) transhydrogenase subunit alpha [Candidatus Limnocylindrales bacterium]
MKVGVARETAPGESRVALVPDVVGRVVSAGHEVLVEEGAGRAAYLPDRAFEEAGARIVPTVQLYRQADVILRVQKPSADEVRRLRKGQAVIGLLQPLIDPGTAGAIAERGATAISLDLLPRTLSRAQTMDALSSQANVGGYKAVLIAATLFGRYFPLLTTAAGTAKPANVLVLGIGVAGLQAIATARRLGALVKAYDVRPETKEQAESLGAQFLTLKSVADATGSGGYARELTAEEREAQQREMAESVGQMDIVITTAQVPGRRPPVLVTADAVRRMKPGSVIVDMAASDLGGNVELSKPNQTVVTDNGVQIHAPTNLPATMAAGSSSFYARNISALLLHLAKDGALSLDFDDEITRGTVVSHEGKVVNEAVAKALRPESGARSAQSAQRKRASGGQASTAGAAAPPSPGRSASRRTAG